MGVGAIPLIMMAVGTAAQVNEQRRTEKRQDGALAESLRNQGKKEREAGKRVDQEVEKLKISTADESRRKTMDSFMETLTRNKAKIDAGLTPAIGSEAFRADAASTSQGVNQFGADTAGLLSRMDAPAQQRQGEATGYGHLATDLNLIDRAAKGQAFLDELRLRSIKPNPWVLGAGSFLSGMGGAMATKGAGA